MPAVHRDDIDLSTVKWKDVAAVEWPTEEAKADERTTCVFYPSCDTVHAEGANWYRCGNKGDQTCLKSRLKNKQVVDRLGLPEAKNAWVCPPCAWAISGGALLIDPDRLVADQQEDLDDEELLGVESMAVPPSALASSDPAVRALALQMQQQQAAYAALQEEVLVLRSQTDSLRVPFDIDLRRVCEWVPFLGYPSSVDEILNRLRHRYGPFPERPETDGSGRSHELRVLWGVLSHSRNEKEVWTRDRLPFLHQLMVRMEALRIGRESNTRQWRRP
ncbi:hypothetical protein DIPPA_03684 [Diplonema papillatum]|nr:hypothetical protein DIPPA_03684 [Diplonema papillatum]